MAAATWNGCPTRRRVKVGSSGEPGLVLVGTFNKQVVSGFAGRAAQQTIVANKTILGAASLYASDFGDLKIVPNRTARGTLQDDSPGWWLARPNMRNWALAPGDFSLAHTATVPAWPRRDGGIDVLVTPRLHVSDQYDWHREGRPVNPPVPAWVPERLRSVRDADALTLVEAGLAREYSIRGSLRRPLFRFRLPPPSRAQRTERR